MGQVKKLGLKGFKFVILDLYLFFGSYMKLQEDFKWVGN